jgi:hypothetical protein
MLRGIGFVGRNVEHNRAGLALEKPFTQVRPLQVYYLIHMSKPRD